jgi:hypothetical protein
MLRSIEAEEMDVGRARARAPKQECIKKYQRACWVSVINEMPEILTIRSKKDGRR